MTELMVCVARMKALIDGSLTIGSDVGIATFEFSCLVSFLSSGAGVVGLSHRLLLSRDFHIWQ